MFSGHRGSRRHPSVKAVPQDEQVCPRDLVREMAWFDGIPGTRGVDRSANPSPGQQARRPDQPIVEKRWIHCESGTSANCGRLPVRGERSDCEGLIFAATPASDFIAERCNCACP